jgi:hypothetical protein
LKIEPKPRHTSTEHNLVFRESVSAAQNLLRTSHFRPYKRIQIQHLRFDFAAIGPHDLADTRGEVGTLFGTLEPTVTAMLIVRYYVTG